MLELHSDPLYIVVKRVMDNARLCRHCYKPYDEHTAALSMCPWPNRRQNHFSPISCQHISLSRGAHTEQDECNAMCGREVVVGTEYCSKHIVG